MTHEFKTLTPAEIHAYEMKAHALRSEATRDVFVAIVRSVKSLAHRVVDAFTRPAHA